MPSLHLPPGASELLLPSLISTLATSAPALRKLEIGTAAVQDFDEGLGHALAQCGALQELTLSQFSFGFSAERKNNADALAQVSQLFYIWTPYYGMKNSSWRMSVMKRRLPSCYGWTTERAKLKLFHDIPHACTQVAPRLKRLDISHCVNCAQGLSAVVRELCQLTHLTFSCMVSAA